MKEHKKRSEFLLHVSRRTAPAGGFERHLEFFELLQNHVVWHVVKEAIARRKDDVTELHVEGGAVSSFRAGGGMTRSVTSETRAHSV